MLLERIQVRKGVFTERFGMVVLLGAGPRLKKDLIFQRKSCFISRARGIKINIIFISKQIVLLVVRQPLLLRGLLLGVRLPVLVVVRLELLPVLERFLLRRLPVQLRLLRCSGLLPLLLLREGIVFRVVLRRNGMEPPPPLRARSFAGARRRGGFTAPGAATLQRAVLGGLRGARQAGGIPLRQSRARDAAFPSSRLRFVFLRRDALLLRLVRLG